MVNDSLPRWAAPFLGAGVGALIGVKVWWGEAKPITPGYQYILAGAGVGLIAGILILVFDRSRRPPPEHRFPVQPANQNPPPPASEVNFEASDDGNPYASPIAVNPLSDRRSFARPAVVDEQTLLGRLLTFLSMIFYIFPFVGLVLGIAAILVNRRTRGWPPTWVWIAMGVSVAANICVIASMVATHR